MPPTTSGHHGAGGWDTLLSATQQPTQWVSGGNEGAGRPAGPALPTRSVTSLSGEVFTLHSEAMGPQIWMVLLGLWGWIPGAPGREALPPPSGPWAPPWHSS